MIDADVTRLRTLRAAALRARELARALSSDSRHAETCAAISGNGVLTQAAVICWAIARVATGNLRAHPYLSYQKGPSGLQVLADRVLASAVAVAARRRGRTFSALKEELDAVAREVDDTRALTRLPDLSDSLGRSQIQLRRLFKDLEVRARTEVVSTADVGDNSLAGSGALKDIAQADWPYLAI